MLKIFEKILNIFELYFYLLNFHNQFGTSPRLKLYSINIFSLLRLYSFYFKMSCTTKISNFRSNLCSIMQGFWENEKWKIKKQLQKNSGGRFTLRHNNASNFQCAWKSKVTNLFQKLNSYQKHVTRVTYLNYKTV